MSEIDSFSTIIDRERERERERERVVGTANKKARGSRVT
jgi:hypothetical protein